MQRTRPRARRQKSAGSKTYARLRRRSILPGLQTSRCGSHYFPPFQIFRERPTASTKYQTMNGEISRKKKATVRMSSIVFLSDCGHFAHASREARAQRPQSLDMWIACSRSFDTGRYLMRYSGSTTGTKSAHRKLTYGTPGL